MTRPPRFWLWLPGTRRWIDATRLGAEAQFHNFGYEVAYGRHHPCRPGAHPDNFPPLMRADQWRQFIAAVDALPGARHRLTPI